MIQMSRHFLEHGSLSQCLNLAKAVSTYLTSSMLESRPSTLGTTAGTEETVQFMMVNSLLSESYESWSQERRAFLQRGIYHTYMQHTHGRSMARQSTSANIVGLDSGRTSKSPTSKPGSADELLFIIRPILVYSGLIEQLQQFFKVKKSANVSMALVKTEGTSGGSEGDGESASLEDWEVVMKERLLNVKELVGFSKELLTWLDDMNSASDLQEAFDIIGVLADLLSVGVSSCEDFVDAAINAGKG